MAPKATSTRKSAPAITTPRTRSAPASGAGGSVPAWASPVRSNGSPFSICAAGVIRSMVKSSPLASAPTAPLYRLARRRHSGSAPALPRLRTQPDLGCRGGTVEGRTIPSARRTGPYFEQVFHARLAVGLRRLGYGIAERGRGWEIAGGPASVLQKFSRRTAVIDQAAADKGVTDAETKGRLGAATRERKTRGLSRDELRAIWRERLSADEATALASLSAAPSPSSEQPAAAALDQAIAHCFERASAVPVATLLKEALRFGKGWLGPAEMQAEFNRRAFIACREGRHVYVTTPALLTKENATINFVRATRGNCTPARRPSAHHLPGLLLGRAACGDPPCARLAQPGDRHPRGRRRRQNDLDARNGRSNRGGGSPGLRACADVRGPPGCPPR